MKRYFIFDCTKSTGTTCDVVGPKFLAHFVSVVISKVTGRFHDYAEA